jgi:hypothetical protein
LIQSFHLSPFPLPHALSSSSPVATAEKDPPPVSHRPSDPHIYFINHSAVGLSLKLLSVTQSFLLLPFSLPHAHPLSSSVATTENDLLLVLRLTLALSCCSHIDPHVNFVPHGYLINSIPWYTRHGSVPTRPMGNNIGDLPKPIPRTVGIGFHG